MVNIFFVGAFFFCLVSHHRRGEGGEQKHQIYQKRKKTSQELRNSRWVILERNI